MRLKSILIPVQVAKGCVTACHSLNGLDDDRNLPRCWFDSLATSLMIKPMMQHVTTACHHCVEPACMHGCPVNAYEKDPITGIVKHLDDQCIGCQYCTLSCPYGVPKYHHKKGIVRKCDMCSDRLSGGEAPACVQACPHQAISIRLINKQDIIAMIVHRIGSCRVRMIHNIHCRPLHINRVRALPPNLMPARLLSGRAGTWALAVGGDAGVDATLRRRVCR